MEEPKLIYKYTHAQALAGGELRKIEWPVAIPLYISLAASKLFEGEADDVLAATAAYALLMGGPLERRVRIKGCHNGTDYELVCDLEVRDDDKVQPCCTIVAPGER